MNTVLIGALGMALLLVLIALRFHIGAAMAFTFGGDVAHVFDPETGKNLEA